jgi:hypothetical protein
MVLKVGDVLQKKLEWTFLEWLRTGNVKINLVVTNILTFLQQYLSIFNR